MTVDLVLGARPNYMKAAALYHAWREAFPQAPPFALRLVDTGQHYDPQMSSAIGEELGLPRPDVFLEATGSTASALTAQILLRYGALLQQAPPAAVIVVGDVTSTLAAALAARQAGIFLVHVEAGLRSGDRSMPEEHNRILTDAMSDLLFATSETSFQNLLHEGIAADRISLVGNTMIDTLCRQLPEAREPDFWAAAQLRKNNYFLLTMHRPANVDHPDDFLKRIHLLARQAHPFPVLFPTHTRTTALLREVQLPENVLPVSPQGYRQFLFLLQHAKALITDSGGASEEAAFLKKRCLVLRSTTERPETLTCGAAVLIGSSNRLLEKELDLAKKDTSFAVNDIPLWDGKTGLRVMKALKNKFSL